MGTLTDANQDNFLAKELGVDLDERLSHPSDDRLVSRLNAVTQQAASLAGVAGTNAIVFGLEEAVAALTTRPQSRKPFQVTLLGGTGVGKSCLFGALIGQPNASPSAGTHRPVTTRPYVAGTHDNLALAEIPAELDPQFIMAPLPGVVLCDSPDVDGVLARNWEVTRRLVEASDLVVYVSDPDKYANFAIHEEIRRFAAKKRWYFVLNRMDRHEADATELRADFDKKLHTLGFTAHEETRFLVSALAPEKFDFPRLRAALVQGRSREQVRAMRVDTAYALARHALREPLLAPLEELAGELEAREGQLTERIAKAYVEGLRQPEAAQAFRLVIREPSWRHLGDRCGPLLAVLIALRCRLGLLWAGFSVGRLALRGPSLLGLLGVAVSTVGGLLRGALSLRQIVVALGPAYRAELDHVKTDARRFLEDRGLEALGTPTEASEATGLGATLPGGQALAAGMPPPPSPGARRPRQTRPLPLRPGHSIR